MRCIVDSANKVVEIGSIPEGTQSLTIRDLVDGSKGVVNVLPLVSFVDGIGHASIPFDVVGDNGLYLLSINRNDRQVVYDTSSMFECLIRKVNSLELDKCDVKSMNKDECPSDVIYFHTLYETLKEASRLGLCSESVAIYSQLMKMCYGCGKENTANGVLTSKKTIVYGGCSCADK